MEKLRAKAYVEYLEGANVIHLTVAIGDFMVILLQAALWLAADLAALLILAAVAAGGTWFSARALWRRLHRPEG